LLIKVKLFEHAIVLQNDVSEWAVKQLQMGCFLKEKNECDSEQTRCF